MNTKKLVRDLQAGKLPGENFKRLREEYREVALKFADLSVILHLTSFLETDMASDEVREELCRKTLAMIKSVAQKEDAAEAAAEVAAFRGELKKHMEIGMIAKDHFRLYRYVLTGLRSRFFEAEAETEVSAMVDEIMTFLSEEKDSSVLHVRLQELTRVLPVRMTKQHFFDRLKDGLSLYKGQDKNALEEFLYMFRTETRSYTPEGYKELYPSLYTMDEAFWNRDYKELSADEFAELEMQYNTAAGYLALLTDTLLMIIPLVNAMYARLVLLTAGEDTGAYSEKLLSLISFAVNEYEPDRFESYEEELDKVTSSLEGHIEETGEAFVELDSAVMSVREIELLSDEAVKKQWDEMLMTSRLLTGSEFADLSEQTDKGELSGEDIAETEQTLTKELLALFEGRAKILVRAVMAAGLAVLPYHYGTLAAIKEEITGKLSSVTDTGERECYWERIQDIMAQDFWDEE